MRRIQNSYDERFFRPLLCFLLLGIMVFSLAATAFAWPTTSQWIPVPKGGDPIQDPTSDAQGSRNIVPNDGTVAAAYVFNDGVNIYFRFRLDADPSGTGGQGYLQSFGWGFEIDTDQNAADYEWLMMCDGITSPEIVALRENTERSNLGDPSDTAERIAAQYPLAGNFQITSADTCYDNQNNPGGICDPQFNYRDYFLDYKIPYSVFKAATGITDTTLIRFFVGSSSAANNLTENGADLVAGSDLYAMASDYVTAYGTLPSGMNFHDGTVRFVSDLNGAFDRNVALAGNPGETLYIRVDDLDQTGQTNTSGTLTVVVTSPTGDTERVTLYATGVRGKYTGSLPTSSTSNSAGTLYIQSGQTAIVTYYDAVTANLTQNIARTDTIYFTAAGTDLALTKAVDNPAPNEGQVVTFTIVVTNNGPSTVTAATIDDLLPAGLTYLTHSVTMGSYSSGTGAWTIASNLAAGASATLTLQATVAMDTNGQTLTNTASLTSSTPADSYTANNTASSSVKVGGTDLRVTKSVNDPLPLEGDSIDYTVRVLNLGPAASSGIQVTDLLPTGVTYASHTVTQGSYTSGTGLWSVGSLASGSGALLKITAAVDSGTAGQIITNTTSLTASSQPDTNSSNNSASAVIKVEYLDLVLSKQVRRYAPTTTSFSDNVAANTTNTVEFKIQVANNGPHDASGIIVTDAVPTGLTYVTGSASATHGSYNNSTGVWTLGSLADKAIAILLFRATVNSGTAGQTLLNEAEITAVDQPDSSPGDEYDVATVAVDGTDLGITKTVDSATPIPGAQILWTITITNNGPNQATNVVVTDLLPAGLTYVTSKGKLQPDPATSQGTFNESSGAWSVGTLNSTASATLRFYTTVNAGTTGQTITNVAFITGADQADPDENNNVASTSIYVSGTDLRIAKAVDVSTPTIGQNVIYTLTVENQGPADATGVVVTDLLPPEVQYVSHTPPAASYNRDTGVWAIGILNSGATTALAITATVLDEDSHLTITNTATITATQADPNPDDNTATIDIYINATDLAVDKVVDNPAPNEGSIITYTVTVTNNGSQQATGVEIEDILPAGLIMIDATPSQGVYTAGLWLIGDLSAGANVTLIIRAVVNLGTAGTTITNSAELVDIDQIDIDMTNDLASVDILPVAAPIITLRKTVQTTYDPVNGSTNPYSIPGAAVEYTITATNSGAGGTASNSVVLSDPIPANTQMYVGPAGGTISPVSFTDGGGLTPPQADSGLSYPFDSLESLTDGLEFYDGSTWNYVPSPDAEGYDANIQAFRISFGNAINGASGGNTPTFEVKFSVRVR